MSVILASWVAVVSSYCCLGVGGGYCGRTASGTQVHAGSVAVHRSVPFGTRFLIPGYGEGIAEDTGGGVGPGRLDVWYWDCGASWTWGRRSVAVSTVVYVPVSLSQSEEPIEEGES